MSPAVAIGRHTARVMRAELGALISLVVMPAILMMVFLPIARNALRDSGFRHATGAEQVVPGMTVGFGLFLLGVVAFAFMSERTWGTWERVRASRARPWQVVVGKLVPAFGVAVTYQLVLFAVGAALFGLRVHGHVMALALIIPTFAAAIVAIGVFVTSVARTPQQVNVMSNICGMGLSALGGAYVPVALLPVWARAIAPVTPTYWAVRGFRVAFLPRYELSSAVTSAAILAALALAFGAAAASRLRAEVRSSR
jgi:ABC-2 type transport system permease protein